MERTTFSLLFYIRRDKLNKRGEAPVFMRLTINGERADASIKRFIEPHAWNSAKGKANEKCCGGKDLNLYLDAISANILRIQRDLELDKKEVSAQIILNCYLDEVTNQFIEDFEFFLKTVRRSCPLQRRESQPRAGRGALLESDARSVRYRRPHEPQAVHGQL